MKERFSISIDEDIIKSVASISNKTGLSKSYIVNRWILDGLKRDNRLSRTERYYFSKRIIIDTINSLFISKGLECKIGDIHTCIIILWSIPDITFSSQREINLFKLSLCGLLDDIKEHDRSIFENIINSLNKLGVKISLSSEISDYNKSSETSETLNASEISLFPASESDIHYSTISVTGCFK